MLHIALYELNKGIMKNDTLKTLLGYVLAASLAFAPAVAFAKEGVSRLNAHANVTASVRAHTDADVDKRKGEHGRTNNAAKCLTAFGHLIAPGWIKHNGTTTADSRCFLPLGIAKKLGLERPSYPATTTSQDTTVPSVFIVKTNTGTSTATVAWFTTERADSQVAYGTTTVYGSVTALDSHMAFFHSATITGLAPAATYHFQVKSRDASGNLGTSADGTLTTKSLPDTAAPVLSALSVFGIGSTTATVSWTTDEPATGKVYFASGTSLDLATAGTVSDAALVTNRAIAVSGLSASTTYSFAVQSQDAAGNTSTSATSSFVTGL